MVLPQQTLIQQDDFAPKPCSQETGAESGRIEGAVGAKETAQESYHAQPELSDCDSNSQNPSPHAFWDTRMHYSRCARHIEMTAASQQKVFALSPGASTTGTIPFL
jgi:hypothetical protein